MLPEKTLLIFLFVILVWICPLSSLCLNLTSLDLRGKQATQDSTAFSYTADLAINGDAGTNMGGLTCSHTDISSYPWWKVDLGTNHCLGRVTLVNRGDCCNGRLSGAIVRAGIESDISKNTACGLPVTSDQASVPGAHIQFVCNPPVVARYVSVDDDTDYKRDDGLGENALTLCEVMVEEYPMEDCTQTKTIGVSTAAMTVDPPFATRMFNGNIKCVNTPLLAVHMKSLMQCFVSCRMKNECLSFDYVMTSNECRLYDEKADDLNADDQPGCLVNAVVRG